MSGPIRNFEATMCSVDIVAVINEERETGRAELRHDHFMVKVEKHPGIDAPKFRGVYKGGNGQDRPCYYLPKREAELMVMSESLKVQTRVYDRLATMESGTLPVAADPLDILLPEQRALIALMVEQAAIKDAQVQLANVQATQQ